MSQTATYILQASPLTRIFLPEWQTRLLEDPSLLIPKQGEKLEFGIHIKRACGDIYLKHNAPTLATSLLEISKDRVVTEDEVAPLVLWLTNPQNSETDWAGIVDIPIESSVADAVMLMLDESSDDLREKLVKETRRKLAESIMSARKRADERVQRACGTMYKFVKDTVEMMKKSNTGVYSPSYSEALALEVMKDSISKRRVPDERAQRIMDAAMAQLNTSPL